MTDTLAANKLYGSEQCVTYTRHLSSPRDVILRSSYFRSITSREAYIWFVICRNESAICFILFPILSPRT